MLATGAYLEICVLINHTYRRCRCDEWYHMQCLNMPENLADLVDQFFCPPCIDSAYAVLLTPGCI